LAQLIALVRADEAGSVGDETEMVDLGGIAAAAVAERVPAALAAGNRETCARANPSGAQGSGNKASRLCPRSSDVDLFGYGKSVIDLNAEAAHRALNLLVSQ
jgi:hypothetical protein